MLKVGMMGGAAVATATLLERVAGTLGLVAGIIVSVGIIFAGARQGWRVAAALDDVVKNTKMLPAFVAEQQATNRRVHERLESGAERMAAIEKKLEVVLATADRATLTATSIASTAARAPLPPRPPRSTD